MDGRAGLVVTSLRARLFIGVTLFVAAFGIGAGILSFLSAFDEAIELQDAMLLQIAGFITEPPPPGAVGRVDAES